MERGLALWFLSDEQRQLLRSGPAPVGPRMDARPFALDPAVQAQSVRPDAERGKTGSGDQRESRLELHAR